MTFSSAPVGGPRLVRAVWGTLLLALPRPILAICGGSRSRPVVAAVRILGARHVLEAVVMAIEHDRRPPRWMMAVDAVHGASMLLVAALSPRLRRNALASAGSATVLVALSLRERR
ncbi:MAG TPA: hypothetical protein VE983_05220 [Solirubrobacteraceae bacterium]|nr:hypothetical protein [Solirubrobacteraceae bacterium]